MATSHRSSPAFSRGDDLLSRCLQAIETAITDEDGLDGLAGERLLREAGYWPPAADVSTRCLVLLDPLDPRTRCIFIADHSGGHGCPDWPGRTTFNPEGL